VFKRVLIANRGEIAVRIIRTLRELGIESVAVYSDADKDSLHVKFADYSYALGGQTSAESYLNVPKILEAIKAFKADAVHPGYGFLSENDQFAEQVIKAGAKFIGPSPEAMRAMGDKITARELMIKNNIPVVPGSHEPLKSLDELKKTVKIIGLPVILKAAAGGGGRGMRVVRSEKDLDESFQACQREAQSYFGNPAVFCERYVENPRHIEFQVLFDEHGNGIHLFERDCTIQRRHQKLIEEAPSSYLNDAQRERLGEIAVNAGKAVKYSGVGTVEFICESPEKVYFMEMNTRIQVEHPVTEMITGVDLIAEQITVAAGKKLVIKQSDIGYQGHAIEVRINAEDPALGFVPFTGKIQGLRLPYGPFTRVDTHIYDGYEIPSFYDSMIAKVIVWSYSRNSAIQKMLRALAEMHIGGIVTTAKFHEALLTHKDFIKGNFTTQFIEQRWDEILELMTSTTIDKNDWIAAVAALAAQSAQQNSASANQNVQKSRSAWADLAAMEHTHRM
jgi:acetyl-CoA carboxylase biotin carboxylase subunit